MTAANRPRSGRIHPDGGSPPPEEAVGTKAAVARALTRVPTVVRRGFVQKSLREHAEEQERAKGLHLPDDEYAAWLAGCARREGREGTVDNLGFYLHMIAPMLCIALMYFTVFSLMDWAVPNHLCNTVAKENSVGGGRGPAGLAGRWGDTVGGEHTRAAPHGQALPLALRPPTHPPARPPTHPQASSFGFQNCINNDLGQVGVPSSPPPPDSCIRAGGPAPAFICLLWQVYPARIGSVGMEGGRGG